MAYFDTKKGSLEEAIKAAVKNETNKNDKSDDGEGLDAVQKDAIKKKFKDRKDKDIDNDGDVDSSDKYLHKRRKAVSKAIAKEEDELDEKFSITLPSGKKVLDVDMGRAMQMLKDFGATKDDLRKVLSGRGGSFKNSGGETYKVQKESVENELSEQKISKELAIKILSMNKGNKFVKASGDLVPEIYMSGMERDQLKKEFGKLPRGLPSGSRGIPVVDMINYALGKDGIIDTEGGETNAPKLISWERGGKVIGRPKDVGDAAKIAGIRLEAYEYGTPEATKHSLKVTPGQSSDDWDKQVGVMQEKQISMRGTLAKMWGVDEGHNPFKEEEEEKKPKKEGKTMTGKPMTKIDVNPDMKEKKVK